MTHLIFMLFRTLPFLFLLSASCAASDSGIPEMILVEGGEFRMGDTHESGDADELPIRTVELSDFYIAKTEITVKQWRAYCQSTRRPMPPEPAWGWIDDYPIVNITWSDAVAYCEWLSERTGKRYRLPTEAEWEFAARGGNKSKGYLFSGGNEVTLIGVFDSLSPTQPQPVKGKLANELGIFDMSGNVWEWCIDWYAPSYTDSHRTVNPLGAQTGNHRVIRGGGWVAPATDLRVSNRWRSEPNIPRNYLGFRPVMEK
ncbi:MAG TPA: formylglycine-generating enzyme family protein [Cyclobacteriaceae bacterium]